MADAGSSASVTPSDTLTATLTNIRRWIEAQNPDERTRIDYGLDDLEPVVRQELDAVADAYLKKMPVFGGIADGIVKGAIGKALDEGLAQLTAAKAQIGA